MTLKVNIAKTPQELGLAAAAHVAQAIRSNPRIVLGLPTGSTPIGMYKELVRLHREEGLDFSQVRTFNLDEYMGLAPTHPQSYRYFMEDNLFSHVNISSENVGFLNGLASDVGTECRRYDQAILQAGGIDLMILGIGRNGHIGFNEPALSLQAESHQVELAQETIDANSGFFNSLEEMPRQAVTMGVGSILRCREILLLANGQAKADAISATANGQVTTSVPSSLLQLHANVTLYLDEAAATKLK